MREQRSQQWEMWPRDLTNKATWPEPLTSGTKIKCHSCLWSTSFVSSKNRIYTTRRMTTIIWRISARLNISLYPQWGPQFAEEQAIEFEDNEDRAYVLDCGNKVWIILNKHWIRKQHYRIRVSNDLMNLMQVSDSVFHRGRIMDKIPF